VFARLLYGFRVSVIFALVLTAIGTVLGMLAGAVQGYFGGRYGLGRTASDRDMECVAGVVSADYLRVYFRAELAAACYLALVVRMDRFVDYVRAEFLRNRTQDYVRARGDGFVECADHLASHPAEQSHARHYLSCRSA